jgi:hypothetical protein
VPDDVLFELMKRAHDRDITLNKMVEEILLEAIENTRIDGDLQEEIDDLEDKLWDDLVEDDHWDDDIIEDEEPKKKKRKKSK